MKLSDLEFKDHKSGHGATQATVFFDNGYGASVITGHYFYTSPSNPYELAVLEKGKGITYETHITDDVLGYLTEDGVNQALAEIQELPVNN